MSLMRTAAPATHSTALHDTRCGPNTQAQSINQSLDRSKKKRCRVVIWREGRRWTQRGAAVSTCVCTPHAPVDSSRFAASSCAISSAFSLCQRRQYTTTHRVTIARTTQPPHPQTQHRDATHNHNHIHRHATQQQHIDAVCDSSSALR